MASKQIFREVVLKPSEQQDSWFPRELCNCCESKSLIGIFSLSDNTKICFLCLDIIRKSLKLEEVYGINISAAKKYIREHNKPPTKEIKT